MDKKYVQGFLQGKLRIGALYDFRGHESQEIDDPGGGTLNFSRNLPDVYIKDLAADEYAIIGGAVFEGPGKNLNVMGAIYKQDIHVPDAYIFCVSTETPSQEYM